MAEFWTIVFAIGAAQGIFLCGVLFLRRTGNATATRLLAALVGVAATMIVAGAVIDGDAVSGDPWLVFLNINSELWLGPLAFLFVHSVIDPARRFTRRDALHLVVPALATVVWGLVWTGLGNAERRFALLDGALVVPTYMLFKAGWSFGYLLAAHRTLCRNEQSSTRHAGGRRQLGLSWLRHAILVLIAMVAVIYVVSFGERSGWDLPFEADPFASLLLAVMIYMVSAMVLQRSWVLTLRPRSVKDGRWEEEAARLREHIDRERPWRRPDLSLRDLAGALGWTDHRLSTVIREGLDTSFYGLVTRHRLSEFERLARDPSARHRSVLELAYEAGFNSKASFYRSFRETHHTTPTAFRKAG